MVHVQCYRTGTPFQSRLVLGQGYGVAAGLQLLVIVCIASWMARTSDRRALISWQSLPPPSSHTTRCSIHSRHPITAHNHSSMHGCVMSSGCRPLNKMYDICCVGYSVYVICWAGVAVVAVNLAAVAVTGVAAHGWCRCGWCRCGAIEPNNSYRAARVPH